MSNVPKNMDSVFADCTADELEFDIMFDEDDSLIDIVEGFTEDGIPLTGPNPEDEYKVEGEPEYQDQDSSFNTLGNAEGSDEKVLPTSGEVGAEGPNRGESAEDKAHDVTPGIKNAIGEDLELVGRVLDPDPLADDDESERSGGYDRGDTSDFADNLPEDDTEEITTSDLGAGVEDECGGSCMESFLDDLLEDVDNSNNTNDNDKPEDNQPEPNEQDNNSSNTNESSLMDDFLSDTIFESVMEESFAEFDNPEAVKAVYKTFVETYQEAEEINDAFIESVEELSPQLMERSYELYGLEEGMPGAKFRESLGATKKNILKFLRKNGEEVPTQAEMKEMNAVLNNGINKKEVVKELENNGATKEEAKKAISLFKNRKPLDAKSKKILLIILGVGAAGIATGAGIAAVKARKKKKDEEESQNECYEYTMKNGNTFELTFDPVLSESEVFLTGDLELESSDEVTIAKATNAAAVTAINISESVEEAAEILSEAGKKVNGNNGSNSKKDSKFIYAPFIAKAKETAIKKKEAKAAAASKDTGKKKLSPKAKKVLGIAGGVVAGAGLAAAGIAAYKHHKKKDDDKSTNESYFSCYEYAYDEDLDEAYVVVTPTLARIDSDRLGLGGTILEYSDTCLEEFIPDESLEENTFESENGYTNIILSEASMEDEEYLVEFVDDAAQLPRDLNTAAALAATLAEAATVSEDYAVKSAAILAAHQVFYNEDAPIVARIYKNPDYIEAELESVYDEIDNLLGIYESDEYLCEGKKNKNKSSKPSNPAPAKPAKGKNSLKDAITKVKGKLPLTKKQKIAIGAGLGLAAAAGGTLYAVNRKKKKEKEGSQNESSVLIANEETVFDTIEICNEAKKNGKKARAEAKVKAQRTAQHQANHEKNLAKQAADIKAANGGVNFTLATKSELDKTKEKLAHYEELVKNGQGGDQAKEAVKKMKKKINALKRDNVVAFAKKHKKALIGAGVGAAVATGAGIAAYKHFKNKKKKEEEEKSQNESSLFGLMDSLLEDLDPIADTCDAGERAGAFSKDTRDIESDGVRQIGAGHYGSTDKDHIADEDDAEARDGGFSGVDDTEGVKVHYLGAAQEAADGDIDSDMESLLGDFDNDYGAKAAVVPDDIQVSSDANRISTDASRSVMEEFDDYFNEDEVLALPGSTADGKQVKTGLKDAGKVAKAGIQDIKDRVSNMPKGKAAKIAAGVAGGAIAAGAAGVAIKKGIDAKKKREEEESKSKNEAYLDQLLGLSFLDEEENPVDIENQEDPIDDDDINDVETDAGSDIDVNYDDGYDDDDLIDLVMSGRV